MILAYLNKIFNNREIALMSYLMIFIIWTLTQRNIRQSIVSVIKAFMAWRILVSIFVLLLYITLISSGLFKIGFWDKSMIKDTVYWTFGVGFIIMMNIDKAIKEEHYFKNLVKNSFKGLIIIEFIVGFYVFSIIIEFILMPFVILFSMLLVYTEVYKDQVQVRKFLNGTFGILGMIYLIYSGYHMYLDINGFANMGNLKTFLFPLIMSVLFVPFVYSFALLNNYNNLFVRLGFFLKDKKLRKFAKWRILWSVNFSLLRLKQMTPRRLFYDCATKNDIKKEIKNKLKLSR